MKYFVLAICLIGCAASNPNVKIERTHNCYINDQTNIDPYYDYAEFDGSCYKIKQKKVVK